jgi:hypothetical protein
VSEKYTFIEAENATVAGETACAPTVTQMCSWLQVSRSGFYEWRARPDSATGDLLNPAKAPLVRPDLVKLHAAAAHAAILGADLCSIARCSPR